jgi:site-specific DNA-adenine methylase
MLQQTLFYSPLKSPLIYSGLKFRIMRELADAFKPADNFYDLFGGSGTVAINALEMGIYKSVYIYEFKYEVFELYHLLAKETTQEKLKEVIRVFKPTTKKGYLALREAYNQNKNPLFLLALHYHSFSNIIDFNKSSKFNVSSGNRRLSKEKEFLLRHSVPYFKKLIKSNKGFDEVEIKENSFVYLDHHILEQMQDIAEIGIWS